MLQNTDPITLFLAATFNVMWLILYALVIRRGFQEKSFGIPVVALMFNLSWDITGAFIYPNPAPQNYFDAVYVVIDLIILYQVLRFWRTELPLFVSQPKVFYVWLAVIFALSMGLTLTFIVEFNDIPTTRSAFIDTLICSALFIGMFYGRPGLRGQSWLIAMCKVIGTGSILVLMNIHPWPGTENSALLPMLYIAIFSLDAIYALLVYQRSRLLGINVLRRL